MYLQYEEVAGFSTYHSNKSTRTVSLVFFLFGYSMPYTNRLANVKEGMLIRRGRSLSQRGEDSSLFK